MKTFFSTMLLSLICFCCTASWSLAQTISFTSDVSSKVYGQSDCNENTAKLQFTWSFPIDSGKQLLTTKTNTFTVYLGNKDETTGVKILTGEIQEGNLKDIDAVSGQKEVSISFDGTLQASIEDSSKGMFQDGSLTIQDIIGYYVNSQQIVKSNLCDLETPGTSTGKIVSIFVTAKVWMKSTTDLTDVGSETTKDGTLEVQFDLVPPLAPTSVTTSPSEKSIQVAWTSEEGFVYDLYYSDTAFTSENAATNAKIVSGCSQKSASNCTASSLENGKTYYFSVRAYDKAKNPGAFSTVVSNQPVELEDFFESYKKNGGTQKGFSNGGYCFIATAAFGSYNHRYVQILRHFRDQYLLNHLVGKAFVAWYYKNSPAWAQWIQQSPKAKKVVQWALAPLIAFSAWLVYVPWHFNALLVLCFLGLLWMRKKQMKLSKSSFVLLVLLSVSLGYSHPVHAEKESIFTKPDHSTPRNFGLEIKMGPYFPSSFDSEKSLTNKAFSKFFGENSKFYLELAFEWLFFKKAGSLGLGVSAGLTWATGQATTLTTTSSPLVLNQTTTTTTTTTASTTSNETSMYILPFRLELTYRFDYFTQKNGFPLVPYVRGGLDYYLWFVLGPPDGTLASFTNADGSKDSAIGGRFGFHVAVGVQFLLDFLDPRAANSFETEVGVNHTYLFFEWDFSWVGVVTEGFNLSSNGFRAGLMFQF